MRFDEAKFLPGGDHFILVQFGDDGAIDLNFLALGLTAAIKEDATRGVVDTNPSYNSLVVEYESEQVSYGDLQGELERLIGGDLTLFHHAEEVGYRAVVPFLGSSRRFLILRLHISGPASATLFRSYFS